MDEKSIKYYSNEDLTVVWKPEICIHSGVCVKLLPKVYDPKARPWISIENASSEELRTQIDRCPSGALSYINNDKNINDKKMNENTTITLMENGPLICTGPVTIIDAQGNKTVKENKTAFCRCGFSANKPFCDGAHKPNGFIG